VTRSTPLGRGDVLDATRIVVKVGSSSVSGANTGQIEPLVDALVATYQRGVEVVLVSSGAIASAMSSLNLDGRPQDLATQQAAAAVGQNILMWRYQTSLDRYGILAGQVLLTAGDLENPTHRSNAQRAMERLLDLRILPIVNENDTVATQEIRFGDNDRLAALVTELIGADLLVLLVTLRLIQGFSLGGEWGGAILLATESSDKKKHAFYAAFPQLGSPIGSILTAALYLALPVLLSYDDLLSWGWRIPFLIAFPLLAVSLWLRLKIDETPVFTELVAKQERVRVPLAVVFRTKPLALILGVGAALLGIGSYSLMNTYTLNYGAVQLGFDYNELLTAVTIGALLQLVTIPLFGALANRIGSARVVVIGAVGTLLVAFPIYFLLQSASFPVLVGMMIIGGILPTMSWAALGGLLSELFGARIRYSAISFAYAIAAIISGFLLPLTYAFGAAVDQAWWHPAIVLAGMSLITAVSAFFAGRRTEPIETL
jgi:MFS family permease